MKNTTHVLGRTLSAEKFIKNFHEKGCEGLLPAQVKTIVAYDRQKSSNDISILSRQRYIRTIKQLAENIKKPFKKMTKEDLAVFLDKLNKINSPYTTKMKKIEIKMFFKFVYGTDDYPNVVKWISTRKSERHSEPTRKILSLEERKALLNVCKNQRDRAIVTLLDQTGCRAQELSLTRIRDVEPDENGRFMTITLGKGKTGRRRIVITEGLSDIQIWMNMHPQKNNPDAPLLVALGGQRKFGPLEPKSLGDVVKGLAKNAGLKRRIYPHLFRHTRATISGKIWKWNEATMRIFFGWAKDSNMPSLYTHMNDDDVNEKILIEAGIKSQTEMGETDIKDRECPRCHSKNPFDAKYCNTCSLAMDSKVAEKHSKIIQASDAMMDMAHERNIKASELVEKHMAEIREKLMADLSAKGIY